MDKIKLLNGFRIYFLILFFNTFLANVTEGKKYPVIVNHPSSSIATNTSYTTCSNLLTIGTPPTGSWKGDFCYKTAEGRVILAIKDEDANKLVCLPDSFNLELGIEITYYDYNNSIHNISKTLSVSYNKRTGIKHKEKDIYLMEGAVYATVLVTSISNSTYLPFISLKTEIEEERFFCDVSLDVQVPFTLSYETSSDQIVFNVDNGDIKDHAEGFDIEWTFVDNYSHDNLNTPIATNGTYFDFRKDASRVFNSSGVLKIPNIFESGYIIFRVRPVWKTGEFFEQRVEGRWSCNDLGKVSDFPTSGSGIYYFFMVGLTNSTANKIAIPVHQSALNWQFSGVFAEDEKQVNSIEYFDGTMRKRQTIQSNYADQTIIVQESIYDWEGRPAIEVLPVPIPGTKINYQSNFNLNKNEPPIAYTYKDFDNGIDCNAEISGMSNSSGASNYYSSLSYWSSPNSGSSTTNTFQNYLPVAFDFPFIHTEFMNDNSGRIRRKGGVGKDFQLVNNSGDPGEHTTRYYYGVPEQKELDIIFGNEVGFSSHYKKNMVIDPNGQISLSYLDSKGKTIATALAGNQPSSVLNVDGSSSSLIINENMVSSIDTFYSKDKINIHKDILVEKSGLYGFYYSITPSYFAPKCSTEIGGPSYDIIYNLKISITDECGNEVFTADGRNATENSVREPLVKTIGHNSPLNSVYNNASAGYSFGNDGNLTKGSTLFGSIDDNYVMLNLSVGRYTVQKTLTIDPDAYSFYLKNYLNNYLCKTKVQFQNEALSQLNTSGCDLNCETCFEQLGSLENYIEDQSAKLEEAGILISGMEAPAAALFTDKFENDYTEALANCSLMCKNELVNFCESYLEILKQDVRPGGQYARYQIDESTHEIVPTPLSSNPFNLLNLSSTNGLGANYSTIFASCSTEACSTFVNGQNKALSELTTEEWVMIDWKESYTDRLVQFHPEYCKYLNCVSNQPSRDFDALFLGTNSYADALSAGFLDPLDKSDPCSTATVIDPFFAGSCSTLSPYQLMTSTMSNFQSKGISIWDFAIASLYCKSDPSITTITQLQACIDSHKNDVIGTGACAATKDYYWQMFRALYFSEKQKLVNNNISACTISDESIIANNYEVRILGNDLPIEISEIATEETENAEAILNTCDEQCEGYKVLWKEQLAGCLPNNPTQAEINNFNKMLDDMVLVCKNGCDINHPLGSSTVSPANAISPTVPFKSFKDVLVNFMTASTPATSLPLFVKGICDDALVTSPKDYSHDYFVFNSENKLLKLCQPPQVRKISSTTDCDPGPTDILSGNSYLDCYCNSTTSNNETDKIMLPFISNELKRQNIRIEESAKMQTCFYCEDVIKQMREFYLDYKVATDFSLHASNSLDVKSLLTSYLNNRLNANLTYPEYFDFISSCTSFEEGALGISETTAASDLIYYLNLGYFNQVSQNAGYSSTSVFGPSTISNNGIKENYGSFLDDCLCDKIFQAEAYSQTHGNVTPWEYLNSLSSSLNLTQADYLKLKEICTETWNLTGSAPWSVESPGNWPTFSINKLRQIDVTTLGIVPWPSQLLCDSSVDYMYPCNNIKKAINEILFPSTNYGNGSYLDFYNDPTKANNLRLEINSLMSESFTTFEEVDAYIRAHCGCNATLLSGDQLKDKDIESGNNSAASAAMSRIFDELYQYLIDIGQCNGSINLANLLHEDFGNSLAELNLMERLKPDLNIIKGNNTSLTTTIDGINDLKDLVDFFSKSSYANTLLGLNCMQKNCASSSTAYCCNYWTPNKPVLEALEIFLNQSCSTLVATSPDRNVFYSPVIDLDARSINSYYDSEILYTGSNPTGITQTVDLALVDGLHAIKLTISDGTLVKVIILKSLNSVNWEKIRGFSEILLNAGACGGTTVNDFTIKAYEEYYPGVFRYVTLYGSISDLNTGSLLTDACCLKLCNRPINSIQSSSIDWCLERAKRIAAINAEQAYKAYVDSLTQQFHDGYYLTARKGFLNEEFKMIHANNTYHYTLYYYDQAGDLVKTVPPKGVNFLNEDDLADVKNYRETGLGSPTHVSHYYSTQYGYNSLNSPIWQSTPDAGKSAFFYDKLGRLVLSQNANQKPNNHYSYTKFDEFNRITEVGQITKTTSTPLELDAFYNVSIESWIATCISTAEQVTQTWYDNVDESIISSDLSSFLPINTRNRVVYSTFKAFGTAEQFDHGIAYTYDVKGNVASLLRVTPALTNLGQEYKRINYDYDLVSGKVNNVSYNQGELDEYYHQYYYDKNNRLIETHTSQRASLTRDEIDARYYYYKHGPLARSELGTQKVQGIDYAYTIQGWLKGVNSSACSTAYDMGHDSPSEIPSSFASDVFAFTLSYYAGDYTSASTLTNNFEATNATSGYIQSTAPNLYNGNIRMMNVAIKQFSSNPIGYTYSYDQLNRIRQVYSWNNYSASENSWPNGISVLADEYYNSFKYDPNGNIIEQKRNGKPSELNLDNLVYYYRGYQADGDLRYFTYNSSGIAVDESGTPDNTIVKFTNQLGYVNDNSTYNNNYKDDIDDQAIGNFEYDNIGNLISDKSEEIETITWSVYGKILSITRNANSLKPDLQFQYSPDGHRVVKVVIPKGSGKFKQYTYYVRDAQGNVMATYNRTFDHIIDFDNLDYVDINYELTGLVGADNFGTFIASTIHPMNSSLQTTLHMEIDGNSALEVLLASKLNFENYLKNGTNLSTLISAYNDNQYLNLVFDHASFNNQLGNLISNSCSNPPSPSLMQHSIINYYYHWLNSYGIYDPTGFASMYTGVTSSTFIDISTSVTDLVNNYSTSLVINWINTNLPSFESDCGIQTSILQQFDNNDLKNLFSSIGNFKTITQNYYTVSELYSILELGDLSNMRNLTIITFTAPSICSWYYSMEPNQYYIAAAQTSPETVSAWQQSNTLSYNRKQYFSMIQSEFGQFTFDQILQQFLSSSTVYTDSFLLSEWHLYGSSRLGIKNANIQLAYKKFDANLNGEGNFEEVENEISTYPEYNIFSYSQERGTKNYELVNHLGNVLSVISDKRICTACSSNFTTAYNAEIISATDYSPFGAPLPGRTFVAQQNHHEIPISFQDFTAGTDSWVVTGSSASVSNSSGRLSFNSSNSASTYISKSYTVNTAKHYRVSLDLDAGSVTNSTISIIGAGNSILSSYNFTGVSHQQMDFVANGPTIIIKILIGSGSGTRIVYIDNIKLEEIINGLNSYRFGFNGKERDDEVKGSGNSIHYELREYDSRLGRMTSIDPRQAEYPWQSSYAYFSNSPIWKIDYLGGGDDKRTASNPNNPDSKGGTQKFHQKKVETDRKNTPNKLPTSTRTPQVVEKKTEFGNSGEFSANIGVISGGQTKIEGNGGALGVTTPILGFKDNDFFVAGNNLSTGQFEKTEVVGFSMGGVGTQQVEKTFSFNRETRRWDQTKLQVTKDFGVLSYSFTNTPNEQVNKISLKLDAAIGFGLNAEFKIQWDLITETQKLK